MKFLSARTQRYVSGSKLQKKNKGNYVVNRGVEEQLLHHWTDKKMSELQKIDYARV